MNSSKMFVSQLKVFSHPRRWPCEAGDEYSCITAATEMPQKVIDVRAVCVYEEIKIIK